MAGRKRKVSVRRQQQHQQGRFLLKQYHHPSSGHQSKSWCVHIFSLAGRNYSFESRHHQIDLQMWRMTGNLFNKYIEEGLSCMQQHKWCYIGDSLCLKLCIVDAILKETCASFFWVVKNCNSIVICQISAQKENVTFLLDIFLTWSNYCNCKKDPSPFLIRHLGKAQQVLPKIKVGDQWRAPARPAPLLKHWVMLSKTVNAYCWPNTIFGKKEW